MLFSTMYAYMRKWMRDGSDGAWTLGDKKEAINIAQKTFNVEAPCILDSMHVEIYPTFSATPTWQRLASSPDAKLYKDANRDDGILEYYIKDANAQNSMSYLITGISRVDGDGEADPGPSWDRKLIIITDAELDDYALRELTQTHANYILVWQPDRFRLVPHPEASDNSTIQIDFRRPIVELVGETTVSLIPNEYHMALTHGATADLFDRRAMFEEAKVHWAHFWEAVKSAKVKYTTKGAEPQKRIRAQYW